MAPNDNEHSNNVESLRNGARILVIDDDPQITRLFSIFLGDEGYKVTVGSRAADAISKARSLSPDLILLDVRMPDLDGYETTRRLKGDPVTSSIPVILITGLNDQDNKLKGLEAGADEFLPKPVDPSELLVRIRSMLRLKEYREQLRSRSLSYPAEHPAHDHAERKESGPHGVVVLLEDESERGVVVAGLSRNLYRVMAASPADGPNAVAQHQADMVILDSTVPPELLSAFRDEDNHLATLAAVPPDDPELRVRLLDWGVSELLVRPFDSREVALRAARLIKQKTELHALEKRYRDALSAASNDSMTQLSNHGYFRRFLELEVKRSRRQNHPTSLIMLDIDDFKSKNDSFGHAMGDMILIEAASRIKRSLREIDLAARYGGEEFAVVLPYTDRAGAAVVAERIRAAIASCTFPDLASQQPLAVTASLGLAVCPDDAVSPEDLIRFADDLMYRAKEAGKNRVCVREE
jgi:two-component system cell cycle response regulator